ncbi:uncharacterized protein LOC129352272 [Poeciliopsis prolifica]|uniref:uncharacterized protein LOC129352272 n=1 Tax=Poeciliopsis prolifica TaxID=188132 RepID=UPI00241397F9|nr:uncharacterized protein LOC129352272 [Poeciliopsis prolifica]
MDNVRLQGFKTFLTEHFTALAVEVFGEVESMMEACYEENKRLRNMLHMVLTPEIKLTRIDVNLLKETPQITGKQLSEPNTTTGLETAEPLNKRPKEETTEYEISWETEQQQGPAEVEEAFQVTVKDDPEDEVEKTCITEMPRELAVEHQDFSARISAYDNLCKQEGSTSPGADEAAHASLQVNEDRTNANQQIHPETTSKNESKFSQQKTMLQMPRMMLHKSFTLSRADQQSFLDRLSEAFNDFPDDQKPLITTLDLKLDGEWTECAFGEVPKGSPISYQCPLPSSQDFKPHYDAPSQPLLPLSRNTLDPDTVVPTLSAQEQTFVNAMNVTWEEAHNLEESTRGNKEAADQQLKMRLTGRFRDICNLKPGRSHAEHLLFKIQKGKRKCKTAQIDMEMKPEALREYCRNLCVNWSPCGLVVHPNAPWLGAMPDGLVYDPKETRSFGLVHIQFLDVKSFIECSFLTCKNGALLVKRAHRHYWHMQGEMLVTGTPWCDLVLYAREDMLVQRIYRDEAFIKLMKKKLEEFFFYYYLPNLI